ncbi:hypothetical protein JTB14_032460 [Gonioctena quinquepunctata]|nr:hypothetical protein JTB14_032460 [Gonioctena quinquepunctata]
MIFCWERTKNERAPTDTTLSNHKGGGRIQGISSWQIRFEWKSPRTLGGTPEKRGSMAQSLGPMTSSLLHVRIEEKYRRKRTNGAKRAMAHIPIIDEILDATKGKNASKIRGVVGLLADILFVTTGRQAHRKFFPIHMIYLTST